MPIRRPRGFSNSFLQRLRADPTAARSTRALRSEYRIGCKRLTTSSSFPCAVMVLRKLIRIRVANRPTISGLARHRCALSARTVWSSSPAGILFVEARHCQTMQVGSVCADRLDFDGHSRRSPIWPRWTFPQPSPCSQKTRPDTHYKQKRFLAAGKATKSDSTCESCHRVQHSRRQF